MDLFCKSEFTKTFGNAHEYPEETMKDIQTQSQNDDYNRVQKRRSENSQISLYPIVIEKLKLNEYYPKKLSREKALAVSTSEISIDDLKDPGKIPWFILQNIIKYNYKGRCFELSQNRSSEMGQSFFCVNNDSNVSDNIVSPSDALVALFMCCDDFLRHILVEKMAMCQLAIPLLLPVDTNPYSTVKTMSPDAVEMLLWGLSTLRKQWKTCSGTLCEQSITWYPFPIVSAVRFSRPCISKSKTINYVINDLKHDTFFHFECDGGSLERKISEGLLEISWYLPSQKDILKEAFSFLNLRGNASHLEKQTAFISEISLATIAFIDSVNLNKTFSLEPLCKQNGHVILVLDGNPGPHFEESLRSFKQICSKIKYKKTWCIRSSMKNVSMVSKEIRNMLQSIFEGNGRLNVPDKSLEDWAHVATKNHIKIDESISECSVAKNMAITMFNKFKLSRETLLPLQKIAIEIGKCKKERYTMTLLRNIEAEKYIQRLESDIKSLRVKQKNLYDQETSATQLYTSNLSKSSSRYFYIYFKIITDRYSTDMLQPIRQEYIKKWKELCEDLRGNQNRETTELKMRKTDIDKLEKKLFSLPLGLEHFNREIAQVYEMKSYLELLDSLTCQYPTVAATLLLNGHPLELMDGDASHVPLVWIEAVLASLIEVIGDKRMFVLSVIGIRSSGKSTMLNAMFGLQFVGRCTKGVFAQLVPLDQSLKENSGYDYIFVVDTEGLRNPELASIRHNNNDNELATFATGLGDVTIINIMGENISEMLDILQIAVHAFMKIKFVNLKPSCIFVHQNVTDVAAADRNTIQKGTIIRLLDEITQYAAEEEHCSESYHTFSDVIQFYEGNNILYISSLWRGDSPMAPPNPGYSDCILQVKKQILASMQKTKNYEAKTFTDFIRRLSDLWEAILCENFVFRFRNTFEIQAFNTLETEYLKHSCTLREHAMTYVHKLHMQCSKLTAENIEEDGKLKMREQIVRLEGDLQTLRKNMADYFCRTAIAFQWKARTEKMIDALYEDIRKEIFEEFECVKKKIIGKAKIDSTIRQLIADVFKRSKSLVEIYCDEKSTESDLKQKFDDEWKKLFAHIPPFTLNINIESSIKKIICQSSRSRYLKEATALSRIESLVDSKITVTEEDLNFGFSFLKIKRGTVVDIFKSACIVNANTITATLQKEVLRAISDKSEKGENYTENFGYYLFGLIIGRLSGEDINDGVTFHDKGTYRIARNMLYSMIPALKNLNEKYEKENGLKLYMDRRHCKLWLIFKDIYKIKLELKANQYL